MPVLAIQPRPDALEIGFSVSLMLSQGFSRFKPSAVAVLVALLSIWLMSVAHERVQTHCLTFTQPLVPSQSSGGPPL